MSTTATAAAEALRASIVLPTDVLPPLREVPENLILFGLPKCGKTTILAELPNSLFIDAEKGSGFVACRRVQPPENLGPVAIFNWVRQVAAEIKKAGHPYDFVIVETISYLDELSEWVGTYNYMHSKQGASFNRYPDKLEDRKTPHPKAGEMLPRNHPDYESVHDMGKGYGYRYSRAAMTQLYDELKGLGRICTIFTCHTAEKQIVSKITNTEVTTTDLSLTGKVKNIYSRDVDAIAYVYNKGGQMYISFKGNEEKVGGMRGATHLRGYEGPLDWAQIFKLNA
jgi:hypothetical protein